VGFRSAIVHVLTFLWSETQVICLTGNHRVDDNPAERERVIAEGGGSQHCRLATVELGFWAAWMEQS